MEAVRVGNYFAEDQEEVLAYIRQNYNDLLVDAKWMKKYAAKMSKENGFTPKYDVQQILAKKPEADGFDIFAQADAAIAAKEAEDAKASGLVTTVTFEVLEAGEYGELQETLQEIAAAAACDADPVGLDELVETMQTCARAGEVGAAAYCGEQIDAVHQDHLPDEILGVISDALKPLMRPSVCNSSPRLTGPWCEQVTGRYGVPNPRKALTHLLEKLAHLRKERKEATGDGADRAKDAAEGEQLLERLCERLAPMLAADPEAARCSRKGVLVPVISRVCKDKGLEITTPVAWDVFRVLESSAAIECDGRGMKLVCDKAPAGSKDDLSDFASNVHLLDQLSRQRLDRRKQRKKARESGKSAKRRRKESCA